jgi:hypothetical protein
MTILPPAATIFLFLTLLALVIGLILMAVGGKINKKNANKLMVARVVFQAISIALICLIIFLRKAS